MKKSNGLRIGTRESALALYQACEVQKLLLNLGIDSEIVEIPSEGDIDLETPLYEMGIQGIFTKTLDIALLQHTVDVAVHSAKDVPTRLAKGLLLGAVLERGPVLDALVLPSGKAHIDFENSCTIASSSLRRKNQWLYRYPHHNFVSLRGNIQTRLNKLDNKGWTGAIFAQAALHRLQVNSHQINLLNWMLPAPAQGAIVVACRENDEVTREACAAIHHDESGICVNVERDFLAALHGGCSVPIAAHAVLQHEKLIFRGNIMNLNATQKIEVEQEFDRDQAALAGKIVAEKILTQGADQIIKTFRPL